MLKQKNHVVVRAPNWMGDIVMSFPFFFELRKRFPDRRIIAITPRSYVDLIASWSLDVDILPFDKVDKGLIGAMRFVKKHPLIKNASMYFALPSSFSSAWLGLLIKATNRIGYPGDFRRWLLTLAPKMCRCHRSENYVELLSKYLNSKIISSPYLDFQNKRENYTLINVNSEAASRRLPTIKWIEFFIKYKKKSLYS